MASIESRRVRPLAPHSGEKDRAPRVCEGPRGRIAVVAQATLANSSDRTSKSARDLNLIILRVQPNMVLDSRRCWDFSAPNHRPSRRCMTNIVRNLLFLKLLSCCHWVLSLLLSMLLYCTRRGFIHLTTSVLRCLIPFELNRVFCCTQVLYVVRLKPV